MGNRRDDCDRGRRLRVHDRHLLLLAQSRPDVAGRRGGAGPALGDSESRPHPAERAAQHLHRQRGDRPRFAQGPDRARPVLDLRPCVMQCARARVHGPQCTLGR